MCGEKESYRDPSLERDKILEDLNKENERLNEIFQRIAKHREYVGDNL